MNYTKGEWSIQLAQSYDEHEFEISYDTNDGLTYPLADIHGKLERGTAEANAHLIAAAPIGDELANFVAHISGTWIEEGIIQVGEGEYTRMKQLALEFLAKAEGRGL